MRLLKWLGVALLMIAFTAALAAAFGTMSGRKTTTPAAFLSAATPTPTSQPRQTNPYPFITPTLSAPSVTSESITITKKVRLTTDKKWMSPSWSPSGDRVMVEKMTDKFVIYGNIQHIIRDLWSLPTDSSSSTQLATNAEGVQWSPDGSKMLYRSFVNQNVNDIYVSNADGTAPAKIGSGEYGEVYWLSSGLIAFQKNGNIWVMGSAGEKPTKLGLIDIAFVNNKDYVFAPSSKRIAYATGFSLFLMNPDGVNSVKLTDNFKYVGLARTSLAWSQDSTRLAYVTGGPLPELWLVNADGSNPKKLISGNSEWFSSPSWLQEGNIIVFGRRPTGVSPKQQIYSINADGTNIRNLSNDNLDYRDLVLSRDGTNVAFINDYDVWGGFLSVTR